MNPLKQGIVAMCLWSIALAAGLPVIGFVLPGGGLPGAWADDAAVWQRWEQTLTAAAPYANAYRDVTLSVNFVSPTGRVVAGYGFWDGGSTFKIRALFDEPGTWTWSTSSSNPADTGLNARSGSITVVPGSSNNPLYQRGMITTSANNRYLAYADGTPFFWLGDTAWVAPLNATPSDWQTYIDDRAAKGFTVVQLSPASDWGGSADRNGHPAFTSGSTGTSLVQWNPAYFQGLDEKIQYANDRGITIALVGIMEPVGRYPSVADANLFARNIAARLSGNQVIFSPSFDSSMNTSGVTTLANAVGNTLNDALDLQLITQHPVTGYRNNVNPTANYYFNQPYMDFSANQSGHNNGDRQAVYKQAVIWDLALYNKPSSQGGPKPVINMEAFYDSNGTETGIEYGTPKDARATAYLSILSGSAGYTYGAQGIWNWETNPAKANVWNQAMTYPSSQQMSDMAQFFNAVEWFNLVPHHERVVGQPTVIEQVADWTKYIALANTPDGRLLIAYLPDNASVTINLAGMADGLYAAWFNPITGKYQPISGLISGGTNHTFIKPADWDDAVLRLSAAPIPEPASFALLGAAGLLIAAPRRSRRA